MFWKGYIDNEIPVVVERIEGVRSVAIGVWVKAGTRYEVPEENGISHFIEHMFFKGTKNRTQKEIASEIDSLGGDLNAYTTRENTLYYVKILDDFIEKGIDLLSDIFMNSLLRKEDMEKEKEIIKEEIKMVEDTPDDYIHDLFYQNIWGSVDLGMPVLGNEKTVYSLMRDDINQYINWNYGKSDIVISCAGNIDYNRMHSLLNKKMGTIGGETSRGQRAAPVFHSGLKVHKKDLSEVHICMGIEGIKQNSKVRYPFMLLNTILGSGVSSRLFQEIRETRGLVYSIYSFLSSYHDTGVFGVYTATGRKKYVEVIETVLKEIKDIRSTVKDSELERAKGQLKGNLMLALESSSGRMNNIARQEVYYGRYYSPSEIIKEIDAVSLNQIIGVIEDYLINDRIAITILGPAEEDALKGIN